MPNRTETYVEKLPKCDFCPKEAAYDARTKMGPWAYMCEECFKKYGVGLGVGRGQKLKLRSKSFASCVISEAGDKPSAEEVKKAAKTCATPSVTMTEKDLEEAVYEGVWYPICPHCGAATGAEPDATFVYCDACGKRFRIINPYF